MTVPLDARERLKQLGAERYAEVERRIGAGESSSTVVSLIQDEWGECADVAPSTLRRQLDRFRASVWDAKLEILRKKKGKALRTAIKNLNTVDELEEVCILQKTRMLKALMFEAQNPLLLTEQARHALKDYVDVLEKTAKIKMDLGLLQRAPKHVEGTAPGGGRFEWTERQIDIMERAQEELDMLVAEPDGPVVDAEVA